MIGVDSGEYHAWTEIIGRDYGWFGIVGPDQKKQWADYVLDPKNAVQHPKRFPVPVLHCEFEGTRIRDMLDAIEAFSFGGKWCKSNWFTRALCSRAADHLRAAGVDRGGHRMGRGHGRQRLGCTWSAADTSPARTGWSCGAAGPMTAGTADGAKSTRPASCKRSTATTCPPIRHEFRDYQKRWCERLSEVPHVDDTGVHPLTPEQQAVADNQRSSGKPVGACIRRSTAVSPTTHTTLQSGEVSYGFHSNGYSAFPPMAAAARSSSCCLRFRS